MRKSTLIAISIATIMLVPLLAHTSAANACESATSSGQYVQSADSKPLITWSNLSTEQRGQIEKFFDGLFAVAEGAPDARTIPTSEWESRIKEFLKNADETATFRTIVTVGPVFSTMCDTDRIEVAVPPRLAEIEVSGPIVIVKGKHQNGQADSGKLNDFYFSKHIDVIIQMGMPGWRKVK